MIDIEIIKRKMSKEIKKIIDFLPSREKEIFISNFNILEVNNKLSFNYFALGIREIIAKTLSDSEIINGVKNCAWYTKYDYNITANDQVTTKQRLAFLICGNNDVDAVDHILGIKGIIEELYKEDRKLNKYAHINTIPKIEQWSGKIEKIIVSFSKFVTKLEKFSIKFEKYMVDIEDELQSYISDNGLDELDVLATHYFDPQIYIEEICLLDCDVNGDDVILKVQCGGYISTELQYGSDHDVRNGDGLNEKTNVDFNTTIYLEHDDGINDAEDDENNNDLISLENIEELTITRN